MKRLLLLICSCIFLASLSNSVKAQERIRIEYRPDAETEFSAEEVYTSIDEVVEDYRGSGRRSFEYSENIEASCLTRMDGTPINVSQVYAVSDSLAKALELGEQDKMVISDCVIAIRKSSAWRLYYLDGSLVMEKEFRTLRNMEHGTRFIVSHDGNFGILDPFGSKLLPVPFAYDDIIGLGTHYITGGHPGIFKVRRDMRYGIIDSLGNMILPVVYKELSMVDSYPKISPSSAFKVRTDEGEGIIDMSGKPIIPIEYESLEHFNDKGLAIARTSNGYGLINRSNEVVLPFQYKRLSAVHGYGYEAKNMAGMYGIITDQGDLIVPFEFERLGSPDRLGAMEAKRNGKYGLVSIETGKAITPMEYDEIDRESGIIYTVIKNKKRGMINGDGKVIFPCVYAEVKKNYTRLKVKVDAADDWYSEYKIEKDGRIAASTLSAGVARDQAFYALRNNEIDRAKSLYLVTFQIETDTEKLKEDHQRVIECLLNDEKVDSAKLILEHLFGIDANDPRTYLTSARIHSYLLETTRARADLKQVEAMNPNDYRKYDMVDERRIRRELLDAYGMADMKDSLFAEAIVRFDSAIVFDPDPIRPYYFRALCKLETKDFLGAEEDINVAIEKYEKAAIFYLIKAKAIIGKLERDDRISEGCDSRVCEHLNKYFDLLTPQEDSEDGRELKEQYCSTCN